MTKTETNADAQRARAKAEIARYEADNDIVPGTASRVGGGTTWEGAAVMALTRLPEDRTDRDWDAIDRYPAPTCSFTGVTVRAHTDAEVTAERRHRRFEQQRADDAAGYVARERADL